VDGTLTLIPNSTSRCEEHVFSAPFYTTSRQDRLGTDISSPRENSKKRMFSRSSATATGSAWKSEVEVAQVEQVKETVFSTFKYQNDHFIKTGSGQT